MSTQRGGYRLCFLLLLMASVPTALSGQRPRNVTRTVVRASGPQGAPPSTGDAVPAIVTQGRVDPRLDVNFNAMALPSTVYVGQQVTYQIGVFLSELVSQRLRRNPEFVPPDVRSMLAYDLPSPARPLRRTEGGRDFDVHVFQRALFPLTAGIHDLAPARLTYALPLSNTFFSREETHAARTTAVRVVAMDPPSAARPRDFAGAVGRLALSARVDTPTSRIGDPVLLVVSVQGVGNVSLFPRPRVELPWGDAVSGAERVAIDSGTALVQGRKDFEWVVTPRREGALELPALRYPYWNPYSEQYEVAITRPIALQVRGGSLAARIAVATDSEPRLPLRPKYRGALRLPVSQSPVMWALLVLVPLPALVFGVRQRPRRSRAESPDAPLRRLMARAPVAAAELRRAFASAVSNRTGVGATAMAEGRVLVRSLRRVGVSLETAQSAQLVLAEMDRATYGGAPGAVAPDLAQRAVDTLVAIHEEAIPRGWRAGAQRGGGGLAAIVAVLWLGGVAVASAYDAADARDAARFARGVALYERGDFAPSMREFRDIVSRLPRAADAWANLGTAAWYASDTASAAIGWQRALRLEPLADDVRGRLESTPGFRGGLLGDVPPVPLDAAVALAALTWAVGWGLLAWARRGHRATLRVPALVTIGGAALAGLITIALAETLSGRNRVIILDADRLRSAPALGADVSSEVLTGEGAIATSAQGVWTRLRFADGRVGWMQSHRLASLELSRAP